MVGDVDVGDSPVAEQDQYEEHAPVSVGTVKKSRRRGRRRSRDTVRYETVMPTWANSSWSRV
jgi:hypothetical protein